MLAASFPHSVLGMRLQCWLSVTCLSHDYCCLLSPSVDAGFDTHDIPYDVLWLDIEHTNGKRFGTVQSVVKCVCSLIPRLLLRIWE